MVVKVTHFISIQIRVRYKNIAYPPPHPPSSHSNKYCSSIKEEGTAFLGESLNGVNREQKRDKTLAIRLKSHYFETILACFHACPLSGRSSFILELRNAMFFKGRKTLGLGDLEKDPRTKARTNNKLYPHVAPCQDRTVAIGGNGAR